MEKNEKRKAAPSEWMDFMQTPEPLHPDLHSHFRDGPAGKMIHHPLMINVMPLPGHHKADNMVYLHRKQEAELCWSEKNWNGYIAIHERPYRAEALRRVLTDGHLTLDQPATWKLIKAVWIDSENVHEHDQFWSMIWAQARSDLTLNVEEREIFVRLPDLVPVWHGLEREDGRVLGLSWTTDKGVAEWFAQRFARFNRRQAYIAAGVVPKENIRAFLLARGEFEVIAFPNAIDEVVVTPTTSSGTHPSTLTKIAHNSLVQKAENILAADQRA